MPIGFSDLLQTNSQFVNSLTKGVVSTDDTFGGVRSKIDDWTDLHLATRTGGGGTFKTFKDDGTANSPGQFKAYSTIFFVADGRALVETATAEGAIRLDSNGEFVSSGGQLYTHDAGTAEPGYYVLTDPTQIDSAEKLPKFTITGTPGASSTVLPAGYESFTSANNSSPAITVTDTNDDTAYNLVFSTAGTDQQLFVDATTTTLTYNPNSGTLNLGTSIQTVSLSTGSFGATGDILSDLIPGDNSGGYIDRDLGSSTLPWHELYVKDAIYFEGTADAHETKIVATDPTGDNIITLPNATGTLAFENADTTGLAGTATALAGGVLGSVPYQSGDGATAFLAGNTAATNLFMRSIGDGNDAAAPTFAAVTKADVGLGNVDNDSTSTILSSAASAAATAGDAAYVALTGGSTIASANPLIFEGASSDGFETTLAVADPDADRTITLPNASGIVGFTAADITAATISSTVNNNPNVLTLTRADGDIEVNLPFATGSNVGTVSAVAQSFGGLKTFAGGVTSTSTFTASNNAVFGHVNNDPARTAIFHSAATFNAATTFAANVSITGNLTVSGDVIQANSTTVDFEDAVLALGVPRDGSNDITNGTSIIDTGLNFVKTTAGNAITEFGAFRYDISADVFKFTRHADGGNFTEGQIISGADNVAALKFTKTDTSLAVDSADVADVYATNNSAVSNSAAVRSLGAVAKCSITITTEATDGSSNFAPVTSAAAGYPIKHNLGTQSIYVVAIKTSDGNTPIFCKYVPLSDDVVKVSVGITAEDDTYDIIVIG